MSSIPSMRGLPVLGETHRLMFDPIQLFLEARRTHGDVVQVPFGRVAKLANLPPHMYVFFHPDDVQEIFSRERRVHRELLRQLLGTGLFINQTGELWRRQRRMLQPSFHHSSVGRMVDTLTASCAAALEERWAPRLRSGEPFDIAEEMKQLTVRSMLRLVFGKDLGDQAEPLAEALSFAVDYIDKQLFVYVKPPRSWPTRENHHYQRAMEKLVGFSRELIQRRKAGGGSPGEDLLAQFMAARDTQGEPMSDKELLDEVLSTFIAGTETTGTSLTWTAYLLASHPEWEERLRAETAAALGSRTPGVADLEKLGLARRAFQEAIRLYPPAWAMIRFLEQPREFRGVRIPEKSRVMVSPYVTHRHPDFWEDAERFDPDRFTPERSVGRPRFAYFPFGGGGHQCIGMELATVEAQLILTMIAQRYRLSLRGGPQRIRARPAIALAPVPVPRLQVTPLA